MPSAPASTPSQVSNADVDTSTVDPHAESRTPSHFALIGYDATQPVPRTCVREIFPGDDLILDFFQGHVLCSSMVGPPKLDVYDVPVTRDNTCEVSFIPAFEGGPTRANTTAGRSADGAIPQSFAIPNIRRMRAVRGCSVSLQSLAPGTEVTQQFADENECLDPIPNRRNTQASPWVSRTSQHHRIGEVHEGQYTISIIPEPPSSQVTASASQLSDGEIDELAERMTRSNLRPL